LHNFETGGFLKRKTLEEIDKYVEDGTNLASLLDYLHKSGKKLFLLTNSPWFYANGVMKWMLKEKLPYYKSWVDYFEFVIVDANKPDFF